MIDQALKDSTILRHPEVYYIGQQARLFNEPEGGTDVLVASDANATSTRGGMPARRPPHANQP